MSRTAIWELHIAPMFRLIDRDHMLLLDPPQRVDLFDYDQVVARSKTGVMQRFLHGHMPPASVGGPWPDEWLALFDRWVTQDKFARLGPVSAEYGATLAGGQVTLVASGEKPGDDDKVWFERISHSETPREYALVREPIDSSTEPGDFITRERFTPAPGVTTVVVNDAKGRHEIPIE